MFLENVTRKSTDLEAKFARFHMRNPKIYELFKRFTFEAIGAGREHYSSRTIFHRIRWHVEIETDSDDRFKINNNHSPYYGRMLMRDFPKTRGFFRTRELAQNRIAA